MKINEYVQLLIQVGRFFLFPGKKNFNLPPPDNLKNPKFMTGRQAVDMIPDGACIYLMEVPRMHDAVFCITRYATGFKSGSPKDLTWIAVAGRD